jgi:hypothetical protein
MFDSNCSGAFEARDVSLEIWFGSEPVGAPQR